MEAVIAAIVTGVVTLIVCLINNSYQNKATRSLIEYRLCELEKKVDKHNQVVERTYRLEEARNVHEEKLKVVNHRLEDLERSDEHERKSS